MNLPRSHLSPLSYLPLPPSSPAVLTSSYFGPFETTAAPAPPSPALPPGRAFNAPDGCVEETRPVPVPGAPGVTVDVPTGVQKCDPKKNEGWAIFPWVAATSGAGAFPGCAAAGGATVLGAGSPLYTGSAGAAARAAAGVDAGAAACQNFVPSAREAAAGGAGADAPAPAPAPGR